MHLYKLARRSRARFGALVGLCLVSALGAASPALAAPPANDDLASAQMVVTHETVSGASTVEATREVDENQHNGSASGHSVWFSWTPATSGNHLVTTCGSSFDTVLGVYTGTTFPLTQIAVNDDSTAAGGLGCGGGTASAVSVTVTAGTTYLIAVDGHDTGGSVASGTFELHVGQPANDAFALAQDIPAAAATVVGETRGASREAGEPTHGAMAAMPTGSAWWTWTAPASGPVRITTCGSSFDTLLGVYTGSSVDALTTVAANDNSPACANSASAVTFTATAGTTYRIAVDGANGATGDVVLHVNSPANDDLADATAVFGSTVTATASSAGAGMEPGEPQHAGATDAESSIWFDWIAPADGETTIDTCSSGFDTLLGVYTGAAYPLTEVASSDDAAGCSPQSAVTFTAVAGTLYRIAVAGPGTAGTSSGPVTLHITGQPDTTPPDTTLTGQAAAVSQNTTPTFTFTASEAGSTFECRIGAAAFAACTSPHTIDPALGNGQHTFDVRAVDADGNEDASPASQTFTVDTVEPATTITSGPPAQTNQTTVSVGFSATDATAVTFECRIDGGAYEACTSPKEYTGLGAGSHTVEVRGTDAAGNQETTPASRTFTVDVTAPETSLDTTPGALTSSATASFTFSSPDSGATFQCRLDAEAEFTACASPKQYTGLADGEHTFRVRAVDEAGNADGSPAEHTWTVDTAAPDTGFASTPAALTNSASASFDFTSTEAGATFLCSVDGGGFATCTDPLTLNGLADGPHTLDVVARDAAGNQDATAAHHAWTVDTAAPDTAIDSAPSGVIASTTASLSFTGSGGAVSFECKLDGDAYEACTSPKEYTGLGQGVHTVLVRAVDAAGNRDADPAAATFTVDTIAPETAIESGPPDPSNDTTPTFDFSATDATATTFECSLDGAAFVACADPVTFGTETPLTDGSHLLHVRGVDAAGNRDGSPAEHSWMIDATAPDTTITVQPAPISNQTTQSVSFTADDPAATFQCRLDDGVYEACTSPKEYTGLGDGSHTVAVRATDGAGNVELAPATTTFTVDTAAPETTIDTGPSGVTGSNSPSFAFSSTGGAGFECRLLPGGSFEPCTSPRAFTGLADGSYTFEARAIDAAGNTDPTPATRAFTVDTIQPDTAITSGPPVLTNEATATVEFSATDATAVTFECRLDAAPLWQACTSPKQYTGLADGSHTIDVRATDAAGNVEGSPASRTFTVDLSVPDTSLDSAPSATTSATSATFTFSSADPSATFQCRLDDEPSFTTCASPKEYTGLADGQHTFRVRAVDEAGNFDLAPAEHTWTVDTAVPDTGFASTPAALTSSASATFDFTSPEAGVTFRCSVDGGEFATCADPLTLTGLADGPHTLDVAARDAAGNEDASPAHHAWTVDTTAPDTTLDTAPPAFLASTTASLTFSGTGAPASFECKLDGGAYEACTSPKQYTGLSQGVHTVLVRAVDAAGNRDATPAATTFTVDSIAPQTVVVSGPPNPSNDTTPTFDFSATDATATTFECSLDGAAFAPCSDPVTFDTPPLAPGAHTLEVRAVDAAGNRDASPAVRSWTIDTTAPDTTITVQPPPISNQTTQSVSFSSPDPAATFECRLDSGAFALCTSPKQYTNLSQGSHTITVRAKDPAGNLDPEPATTTFVIDTEPPESTIDTGPTGVTASSSPSFTFSTTGGASFQCRLLPGGSFEACTSPRNFTGLADGHHTLEVRAIDAAGNIDPTPASRSFTVDTTPPETGSVAVPPFTNKTFITIDFTATDLTATTFECRLDTDDPAAFQPCADPVTFTNLAPGTHFVDVIATDAAGHRDGSHHRIAWTIDIVSPDTTIPTRPMPVEGSSTAYSNSADVTLGLASTETGSTFECRVDSAPSFTSCTDSPTFTLADGPHTVEVRAIDPAGNPDTSPASASFVVDTTRPDTSIVNGPQPRTRQTTATFDLSVDDVNPDAFECRLDGGAWAPCADPAVFTTLGDGQHTLDVAAVDAAGNRDDVSPASHTWTIDTVAPDTTVNNLAGLSNQTTQNVTFNGSDASGQPVTFECKLDDGPWAACTSPKQYTGLSDGQHRVEVRAIDDVGNVDPTPAITEPFTIDTAPPATSVTGAPTGFVSSTTATVNLGTAPAEPNVTFQCRLDGGAYEACTSPKQYTSLSQGPHTIRVRATDAAGNVDPTEEVRTFTVDTIAPDTGFASRPTHPSSSPIATFDFTANDTNPGGFECKLDDGPWAACTDPATFSNLTHGSHTLQVRAVDLAGNRDGSAASYVWTVDLVDPVTTLDAAPTGVVASATQMIEFHADEPSSFDCKLDGGTFQPCTSPKQYTGLADGTHTILVRAVDAAGNADDDPAATVFTVDTEAPETTITSQPRDPDNNTTATFGFSATDLTATEFECRLEDEPFAPCDADDDLDEVVAGLADGEYTFEVRAIDAAGHVDPTPDSYTWVVDTVAPDTQITAAPPNPTNQTTVSVTFTSPDDATAGFQCSIDGQIPFTDCGSIGTGTKSYSGLTAGEHTIVVRARDAAGNADSLPASVTFTVDITPAGTTIDSFKSVAADTTETPLATPFITRNTTIKAQFSSTEPSASFECRLDDGAWAACTPPHTRSSLTDGPHTFEVRSKDVAGNVDPSPDTRTFRVDTVAPETTILTTPPALTNATTYSFGWRWDDPEPSSGLFKWECRLNGGAWQKCGAAGDPALPAAVEGSNTFEVRTLDNAGNADPTPATHTWTVDLTDPVTSITLLEALDGANAQTVTAGATTRRDDFRLTFGSEAGATFRCQRDSQPIIDPCTSPRSFDNLAPGAHTLRVWARDAAGNLDDTPAEINFTVDQTPAQTAIGQVLSHFNTSSKPLAPGGHTNLKNVTFQFSSESGATFECKLTPGDASFSPCTSPKTYSNLADSAIVNESHVPYVLQVRATDQFGNTETTPQSFSFVIDTVPPVTELLSATVGGKTGPSGSIRTNRTDFSFGFGPAGMEFKCTIDNPNIEQRIPCQTLPGAARNEIVHTLRAWAEDAAGNVDPTPVEYAWTYDETPPTTELAGVTAVSGSSEIVLTEGAHTNRTTVKPTFSSGSDGSDATFECRFGSNAFSPCASGQSFTGFSDGTYTFQVRAKDVAGNVDDSPSSRRFVVDTTGPTITINRGPEGLNPSSVATFEFSATDVTGVKGFTCAIDGPNFTACTSPRQLSNLADGEHTFRIRAEDSFGAVREVSRTWRVDSTPPETGLFDGPSGTVNSTSATFTLASNEVVPGFECRLDDGAWGSCGSPVTVSGLGDGIHTFQARARDAAGNVDTTPAGRTWTVQTVAPPPPPPGPDPDAIRKLQEEHAVKALKEEAKLIDLRLGSGIVGWEGKSAGDRVIEAKGTFTKVLVVFCKCTTTIDQKLILETKARRSRKTKKSSVTLKRQTLTLVEGQPGTVRVRLPKRQRNSIKRARRARVQLTVSIKDAAGKTRKATRTYTVRIPKAKKAKSRSRRG